MSEDAAGARALLQLMWLASPALPVGAFSYSEGLESAVEAGRVTNEAGGRRLARRPVGISAWHGQTWRSPLRPCEAWQQGRLEQVAASNDWVRADPRIDRTAPAKRADGPLARRVAAQRRRRHERRRSARRLAGGSARHPTWPVAFALAAARPAPTVQERAAVVRLRLGREHGPGRDEGRAARSGARRSECWRDWPPAFRPPSTHALSVPVDGDATGLHADARYPVGAGTNRSTRGCSAPECHHAQRQWLGPCIDPHDSKEHAP